MKKINIQSVEIYECINCGEVLDHCGKFCSDWCMHEHNYQNRTCKTCGGEFWDGGTSCSCEDWESEDVEDWFPDNEATDEFNIDDLPF